MPSKRPVRGPLRKVLGNVIVTYRIVIRKGTETEEKHEHPASYELLECGHIQMVKQDIYGEYYSPRRRCSQCRQGAAPQFDEQQMKRFHAGEYKFLDVVIEV